MGEEIDPEEENLRVIYDSILDFYEVHNTEKLDDEDSLAVIMDFWIDYGLAALNRRLKAKYKDIIKNVKDPYPGA